MPIQPWRATCIQMKSRLATQAADRAGAWETIRGNLDRALTMIEATCAVATPPKLVVLPEFAFQGPPHGGTIAEWIDKACCPIPGDITAPLQDLAKRRRIFIAGNQFEFDPVWPGRYFNCCFLIDPAGAVILRFRRINTASWPSPHDFMDAYVAHHGIDGTFPVVETELGRLAMIACGELAVPEVARVLMMRGAEIILHPTNEGESAAQEAAKIARAGENMVYLISADVAGGIGFSADGSVQGGRSRIVDFRGNTLAFHGPADETTLSAMIDVEALRAARRDLGMGNTLLRSRFEMYRGFYAGAAFYPANAFLSQPMAESSAARTVAEKALENLTRAGVVAGG
ncbi:MAG: amidohydrolase [Alphaproteobacteria bacterium]|nr:amidohydrolase [Alphaproteobacteria bacterium]